MGDWRASGLGQTEEAVEFAAGGVEGAPLLVRAVVNQRASVLVDHVAEKAVHATFLGEGSWRRSRMIYLPAQHPKVVHMPANRLGGKGR